MSRDWTIQELSDDPSEEEIDAQREHVRRIRAELVRIGNHEDLVAGLDDALESLHKVDMARVALNAIGAVQLEDMSRPERKEPAMHETLGRKGRDTANGFVGKITARTEYLTGCVYLLLETCNGDGDPVEHWTDEARVEVSDRD